MERHRIHVAWSPVWSFHSQWWFGLPCHLLVLVHTLCFLKSSQRSHLPENFRAFHASFCWQVYGDVDFIFQQDLAPVHTAKGTKSWFNDHGVTVLDWPANSPDLNPIENLWGPEGCYQSNLGLYYTWAVPQADWLHATPQWCSNSCKTRLNQVLSA